MPKFSKVFFIAVLAAVIIAPGQGLAWRRPYHLTARTALLWDPANNHRYFDLGADREVYPASTTKVLTILLALEHLSLDQYVTVPEIATRMPETKLGLRAGESYRVRDLIYGMLLMSANDAAVTLAQAVAGSQEKFVDMMNAKARELGALHSHFANPDGLPSRGPQYTTAADMSLIFTQALKNDFFRQAITHKYMVISSRAGRRFFLRSFNKTLFFRWRWHVFGKTGYTREARFCFVGYIPRGRDTLVIAVYGCRHRWTDMKYIIEHYGHILL
ncbi:MAG: D-alanyl-D-alanine carboxypeptidase [Candidatus Omnitrophica bacterium]|nr:D-alanyl-D-alanine carboxypeptidase [Candidatus Omnitrophota bacterium]MDE2009892.1 D-alanyl-D-alanine carboxypeptidase [Candidatus Omnitrophota bacterium]MDE2232098.1 D-alanyl-D-alanine carboxypeptidase [Candidatus Omnitrophota bacterium]